MTQNKLERELNICFKLLQRTNEIARQYFKTDFGIEIKSDGSPVTLADKEINEEITEMIKQKFPKDGIVSEESNEIKKGARTWYIDPIDGTKQFVNRTYQFATHIGLVKGNKPIMGIVSLPMTHEIYVGVKGEGAFRINYDNSKTNLGYITKRKSPIAITSLNWDNEKKTKEVLNHMDSKKTIRSGGMGVRLMKILENKADFWFPDDLIPGRTHTWDSCAPQAILEAAGMYVTNWKGNKIEYTHQREIKDMIIVASTKEHHNKLIQTLEQLV